MTGTRWRDAVTCIAMLAVTAPVVAAPAPPTMQDVLAAADARDWRTLAVDRTVYLRLDSGIVTIEVAPRFAPRHVDNLRKLIEAAYFDKAAIVRAQDNYVVQWSGATGGSEPDLPDGVAARLAPEFYRDAADLPFTVLDSRDAYAAEVGFVDGFPAGRDGPAGRAWLAHCYGMLGVGRDNAADSGNGAELYVVTGHAPRHLDRNVTLIGRVIDGIERLSSLPRGTGPLGFHERENEFVPIRSMRFATARDPGWQVLRTDTATFQALVAARRHRGEEWFVDPADAIGLCNVPLPARRAGAPSL